MNQTDVANAKTRKRRKDARFVGGPEVSIRMTPDQRDLVRQAAAAAGADSQSEWARTVLIDTARDVLVGRQAIG